MNCQGATAYTMGSLQTTCLVRVSHLHELQDIVYSLTLHRQVQKAQESEDSQQNTRRLHLAFARRGARSIYDRATSPLQCGTRANSEREYRRWLRRRCASQRSLHNAPIFRLLLKVAVNGTHQCDFLNFCGASSPQQSARVHGFERVVLLPGAGAVCNG